MEIDKRIEAHLQQMDADTRATLSPFFAHPSQDEWVRDVLIAYFSYYFSVGGGSDTDQAAKRNLQASLKPLVPAGWRRSLDKMEAFLSDEFHHKGYSFLGGRTGPYYGPYVWKRTERLLFDVDLPDRRVPVDVFFLYDFLLRSWMHFQTFGKSGTGGWVKRDEAGWEDGLYCVADAYDLEHLDTDLSFQVSLLKHEARHFADKADFPDMTDTELEYRAKLTELIYYPEMNDCFIYILQEADPVKADPHRYASYLIVKSLSKKLLGRPYEKDEALWQSVPYETIQAAVIELFQADTERLHNKQGRP